MKKLLLLFGLVMFATIFFIAGIFVANTEWFNETFYIPSMQMQNLSIKSLKHYDTALFKIAQSHYEMNSASNERYEHYHEYFKKVTDRIKNYDYTDENVKTAVISYLDGYEKRKNEIDYTMFPC